MPAGVSQLIKCRICKCKAGLSVSACLSPRLTKLKTISLVVKVLDLLILFDYTLLGNKCFFYYYWALLAQCSIRIANLALSIVSMAHVQASIVIFIIMEQW